MSATPDHEDTPASIADATPEHESEDPFTVNSLGIDFQKSSEKTTILPRRVFDTPEIIAKHSDKLNDYSQSRIRARTLNHLTTYRGINGLAITSPTLGKLIFALQERVPTSIKPAIKSIDGGADYLLGWLDGIVPYRFRAFPISLLSDEQKKIREDFMRGVRAFATLAGFVTSASSTFALFVGALIYVFMLSM